MVEHDLLSELVLWAPSHHMCLGIDSGRAYTVHHPIVHHPTQLAYSFVHTIIFVSLLGSSGPWLDTPRTLGTSM